MSDPAAWEANVWRRLPDSDEPMDWQLARTESLFAGLEAGTGPTLRWYHTSAPALVLGRSQRANRADVEAARAGHIPIYGRTSGGGAVFIDGDALSLDIALPAGHPLAVRDVTLSYRPFGEVWAAALHRLGVANARALATEEVRAIKPPPLDDPLRLACYGTLSPWEVVVDGRKVIGLSQVRRRPGAILSMGVHLRWQPAKLTRLLAVPPSTRDHLTSALRSTTAGMDELAGREVAASEVVCAFETALHSTLGSRLASGSWLPQEREAAAQLRAEQFVPFTAPPP